MDVERFGHDDQYSPSLPPFEAWKRPEKWLNLDTGLPKRNIDKIEPPVDERGFIDIDAFVPLVQSTFFVDDYEWPYDPQNYETRTDDHHFYFDAYMYGKTMNFGDDTAKKFRELPPNVGRMPRQFHNTIHALTERPYMPDRDEMYDYVRSYQLANLAFKRLYRAAHKTVNIMGSFTVRRQNVAEGLVTPSDDDDSIAEEILRMSFKRHFNEYSDAVERFKETEGKEIVYKDHEAIKVTRPIIVARKIGAIVNRKSVTINLDRAA